MKKRIISFFTALSMTLMLFTGIPLGVSAAVGDIEINATNFPDEIFRDYISRNIDTDSNGSLSSDEIASVTEISCRNITLYDIKGIEHFPNLSTLNCDNNKLTSLDIRQNTALTYLNCADNDISELDVSKNTALTHLDCSFNAITELDVSNNTALTYLGCTSTGKHTDNGELTELDISKNTELTYLACSYNNLSKLDVSQNTKLTDLICHYNIIPKLDISQNPELIILECGNNKLTDLDVSNNKKLTTLGCNNNELTELDVSNNKELTTLGCNNNKLTKLDVRNNTKLTGFNCFDNKLTELDVSQNIDLTLFQCYNNQLASMDVSNNTKLGTGPRNFNCKNNKHTVSTCVLDNDTLPAGFDLSKASGWSDNVETTNDKILYKGTGDVTYTYDCGNGRTATFTLVFPSRDLTKVEAKDATCTEDGNIEYYECSCGYKFKNENPAAADILSDEDVVTAATGHTLTAHDAVPADCTTDGSETYWTCSVCNKMFSDENGTTEITEIPTIPAGHKYSEDWESGDNEHWHECTVCHNQKDIASHTWNDGIVTKPATEDAEGVKTYTCTVCSATKTESIDKLEHTHDWSDTYQSDSSQHWKVCTKCNEAGTKENHVWDSGIVTTEPTEEAAGVRTYTCTVCSATKTESIAQLVHTHTYSTEWTSDSTSHWYAATCGHDVVSERAAHTEDGGTVTVPATTENDGLKTYACSVCGYVMRTVTIPKLGEDHAHNFSPDWKHDSTSHWHECDCGEKNEIAPHVENGGVVTTEPTETSTGIMTYSCSVCGYVMRTDVIPALIPEHNHTFGTDWKYDSVSHWHECECGEKSDIANHISSDWIVVTPATTDLEGVQIRKCTVCDIEIDRETIEKLPNISTGDVAEDVRDTAGTNAGLVQDNTLIENVLTPDDKTEVTEGHSFEIVLEVTDIRDSVPAADVTAASSALRYNEQIGIYVDLSLFKIKDNSERTPIYNTSGRIGITLTVPDSIYASDRTYSIIRVHDGIAENLGGTYNRTNRELTFYTDKFSTYAIAYAASNGGTDRPSVPDTPTNPSVPTYPNTPAVPVTPTVTETTVKKEEEVISDEPYVEDVSSAAGIYESGEADNNIHYVMILIFAAAAGIAVIVAKKHFCKKNMK